MTVGIGSYTYGWATGAYRFGDYSAAVPDRPMNAIELIDKAVALEVKCVQICVRPALEEMSSAELQAIRRHAEASGVALEIGTTGADTGHLLRFAEIAAELGSPLVRTIWPNASDDLAVEAAAVEQVLPGYRSNRVVLAVENHEDYSSHALAALITRVNDRHLGVCLDSVNSLGRGEGTREVTELLLPHAVSVHIKDFTSRRRPSGMGFEITGAPAGHGRLDIGWLISRVVVECPEASIILEQWSDFEGTLEKSIAAQDRDATEGVAYLRQSIRALMRHKK